jgi:serine/threonine protein kinase
MVTRLPAPDGRKGRDDLPILVLPEGTILKESYKVTYYTVGGMSVVYKGEKKKKTYLLKEVSSGDSQRVISLTQEKSMLERFEHPGIVPILDFFEQDGYYYMVLEFIHGRSLDKLLSRTPGVFLDEDLVTDWAFQLYDIFEYLHGQNPPVIYRDLKPQNVIMDTRGRLNLVDFGIARVYKGDRVEDTFSMGSAITASPEHYGMKQTDGRSDIFTIGATLHYILTNGLGPVHGLFGFIPIRRLNPAFSEGLENLLEKAVEIYPENRFQTVQEMRQAHLAVKEGKALEGTTMAGAGHTPGTETAPIPTGEMQVTREMPAMQQGESRRSSARAQQVVTICAAMVLILLGILLGLRLSKTAGSGNSGYPASPSPLVTGTIAALLSPKTPSLTVSATPGPSITPGRKPSSGKATPKPSATKASKPAKPEVSPGKVALVRTPPPLPGSGHPVGQYRPPPPEKRNPPPPGGKWFVSEESGFQVFLPEGYEKVRRDNSYLFLFQRIDNDEGQDSLRYLQVTAAPALGDPAGMVQKHLQKLQRNGCRIQSKRVMGERGMLELSYTRPGGAGEASVREYLIHGDSGRRVYFLLAAASPDNFPRYEHEFTTFFDSFSQTGGAVRTGGPLHTAPPPSNSGAEPNDNRQSPGRKPRLFRRGSENRGESTGAHPPGQ